MGKQWKLNGPRKSKLSLAAVAELLGYDDADSLRRLVAEGRLPPPRGIGSAQYYTGLDVAIILEMFGRWMPSPKPAKSGENTRKAARNSEEDES